MRRKGDDRSARLWHLAPVLLSGALAIGLAVVGVAGREAAGEDRPQLVAAQPGRDLPWMDPIAAGLGEERAIEPRVESLDAPPSDAPDPADASEERLSEIAELSRETDAASEARLIEIGTSQESTDVRAAAYEALGERTTRSAIEACAAALVADDPWVQDSAETMLFRSSSRDDVIAVLVEQLASHDRETRIASADLLDELIQVRLAWDEIDAGPVVMTPADLWSDW